MWRKCDHYDEQVLREESNGVSTAKTLLTAFYLKGNLLGVTETVEYSYTTNSMFLRYSPYETRVVSHNAPYSEYLAAKNKSGSKKMPSLKKPKK